ncbi:hypothetical protein GQX74_002884 [Glossina fuscipes]|nr:hypothetical protein GQX74_002884 [Glossina fuscipes]
MHFLNKLILISSQSQFIGKTTLFRCVFCNSNNLKLELFAKSRKLLLRNKFLSWQSQQQQQQQQQQHRYKVECHNSSIDYGLSADYATRISAKG